MRQGWHWFAWVVGTAACVGGPVAAQVIERPLEVQITQTGFAGETGRLWTIQQDGSWTMRRIGPSDAAPVTGSLTAPQAAELRAALKQNEVQSLRGAAGASVPVNPSRLTIRWGDQEAVLTAPAGQNPLAAATDGAGQSPAGRAATIARTVQRLTAE